MTETHDTGLRKDLDIAVRRCSESSQTLTNVTMLELTSTPCKHDLQLANSDSSSVRCAAQSGCTGRAAQAALLAGVLAAPPCLTAPYLCEDASVDAFGGRFGRSLRLELLLVQLSSQSLLP